MAVLEISKALPEVLLIVRVGERRVALPAKFIDRILPMVEVIPAPGIGPAVMGLMNLHGAILPVVSLRSILDMHDVALDPDQHLVIVTTARWYALWIDAAQEVLQADPTAFERVATRAAIARRVVRLAGEVIPVLSLTALDPGPVVGLEAA